MAADTPVLPTETCSARIRGACVCGAVRWSYDAPLSAMLHCHCSVCRKHHGTFFATFVSAPLGTFHWRAGTEQISTWQSSGRGKRSFCALCGSKVPSVDYDAQQVFMPAGALEGELGIRPQMHLFTASRADAYQIHDGLPQHAEFPPEWGARGLETPARPTRPGIVSGSCACGSMRFEIDGQPLRMHHCHCGRCRRARGAAHATNVIYRLEALSYTAGDELLSDFDLPGARFFGTSFCRNCGGAMPRRSASRGVVVVPVSSLDSDPQIRPLAHQFVAAKAPWFDIHDGVPQYPEAAPNPPPISAPAATPSDSC
jgi:hypothetical protein